MNDEVILALIGVFAGIGRVLWVRAKTRLAEAEKHRKDAEAQAEVTVSAAKAEAQRSILAAEGRIKEVADQHSLMQQMLNEMSETRRQADVKDAKHGAVLSELLVASRESTETLKHHHQRLQRVEDGTRRIETDIGEGMRLLGTLEQSVAELPGQVGDSVNPIVESVAGVVARIDRFIDGLEGAKKQLLQDLIAAIQGIRIDTVRETTTATETLTVQTNSIKDEPAHETL